MIKIFKPLKGVQATPHKTSRFDSSQGSEDISMGLLFASKAIVQLISNTVTGKIRLKLFISLCKHSKIYIIF